jgi:magnesium-transporting ATPase (P-type)
MAAHPPEPAAPAAPVAPWRRPAADVVSELRSDAKRGLSSDELPDRLRRHGRNELPMEPPVPAWRRFLAQFGDVLTILLLVATVVSFVANRGIRHAQTLAFTTLVFYQLFNAFNARSEERSAFHKPFANHWLWIAVLASIALQVAVLYAPFLQRAFRTVPLDLRDWLVCFAVASTVLWAMELKKLAAAAARPAPIAPEATRHGRAPP